MTGIVHQLAIILLIVTVGVGCGLYAKFRQAHHAGRRVLTYFAFIWFYTQLVVPYYWNPPGVGGAKVVFAFLMMIGFGYLERLESPNIPQTRFEWPVTTLRRKERRELQRAEKRRVAALGGNGPSYVAPQTAKRPQYTYGGEGKTIWDL